MVKTDELRPEEAPNLQDYRHDKAVKRATMKKTQKAATGVRLQNGKHDTKTKTNSNTLLTIKNEKTKTEYVKKKYRLTSLKS